MCVRVHVCVCVRASLEGLSGVAEDSGLLGRDTMLSGELFPTLTTTTVPLPRGQPYTA
jgi:hypothetical protein